MSDNPKKCKWYSGQKMDNCKKNIKGDNIYCDTHLYANDYTDEEITNKKYCSSCRKVKCFPDNAKTCGCASERIGKSNEKRKEENRPNMEKRLEEKKKHEIEKQRLIKDEGYEICSNCNEPRHPDSFIGTKGKTMQCEICRNKQKDIDAKRTRVRDYATEYKNNQEREEKKKQWKAENPDKVVEYNKNSRERKIEKMGLEEYNKKNREYVQQYREAKKTENK
jgi:hypothetical protein